MKIRKHGNPRVARVAAKFNPWDYGFMLDIEAKCLAEMAKYVNTRNVHRFIKDYKDFPYMRDSLRREKAWHLYHMMRLQHLRDCWN